MSSTIEALPTELLARIFWLLSENRPDISSCRLVSKAFHTTSSEYLITKVVFAKRLKDIERAQEIADHPYFHKTVTELLYDASRYSLDIASSGDRYLQACERAPRCLLPSSRELRTQEDVASFRKINYWRKSKHPRPPHLFDFEMALLSEEGRLGDLRSTAYMRNMDEYHRMYENQSRLESDGVGMRLFKELLRQFPLLKSIVYTDWRALARHAESFDECARRLFGYALHPDVTGSSTLDDDGIERAEILDIMQAISNMPNSRIESFVVGHNIFEEPGKFDRQAARKRIDTSSFLSTDFEGDLPKYDACFDTKDMMQRLRRIDLAVEVCEDFPERRHKGFTNLRRILSAAPNLEHFAFCLYLDGYQQWVAEPDDFELQGTRQLQKFLNHLYFPRLKSLDLCNWALSRKPLKWFLSRHAATLRIVRLVDCFIDFQSSELATWAGKKLKLDGAEISNVTEACLQDYPEMDDEDIESLWIGGRTNSVTREQTPKLVGYSSGDHDSSGLDSGLDWWYERRYPGKILPEHLIDLRPFV